MVRSIVVQIMIVITLFSVWSGGFASQLDTCCASDSEAIVQMTDSQSLLGNVAIEDAHQDADCASRCIDCTICQSQCNQHGLLSFTAHNLELELSQVYRGFQSHSHPDAPLNIIKEPPRV
ncbi:hypothetical protein ACLVWU_04645 [Bdellovibrio sp. HCB290]|uniref:hypothetical protein n=1 Tax=Bdellovibrio sp. HCB290 TaxID=3394356 RepID=UPI0039B6633D